MECGARMFWGHLGYALLMWMIIMTVMVTTVIITKVRMMLKVIKIKIQWWIKEEEWGGRGGKEWSPISIVPVGLFHCSSLSETKIYGKKRSHDIFNLYFSSNILFKRKPYSCHRVKVKAWDLFPPPWIYFPKFSQNYACFRKLTQLLLEVCSWKTPILDNGQEYLKNCSSST